MDHIYLRAATVEDAPAVLAVTKKAFELYAQAVRKRENIRALYETLDDVLYDIETIHVLVCEPVSYTHLDVYKRQRIQCGYVRNLELYKQLLGCFFGQTVNIHRIPRCIVRDARDELRLARERIWAKEVGPDLLQQGAACGTLGRLLDRRAA